mgnify:CR=1 FL=1
MASHSPSNAALPSSGTRSPLRYLLRVDADMPEITQMSRPVQESRDIYPFNFSLNFMTTLRCDSFDTIIQHYQCFEKPRAENGFKKVN